MSRLMFYTKFRIRVISGTSDHSSPAASILPPLVLIGSGGNYGLSWEPPSYIQFPEALYNKPQSY